MCMLRSPFSPLVTLTIPFCAFARPQAYRKCSILEYLLPPTMVRRRRITPPQYLLLRCCLDFYRGWGPRVHAGCKAPGYHRRYLALRGSGRLNTDKGPPSAIGSGGLLLI